MGRNWVHIGRNNGPADPWELAAVQYGRLGSWQLAALGIKRTQVKSWLRAGRLHPDGRGVYVVPGVPETKEARWMSAVLACGPHALLSHHSAAAHRAILAADRRLVDVTASRSREGHPGIRLHRPRAMPAKEIHLGIPSTSATQILLDLSKTLTHDNLDRAIGEAELLNLLDEDELIRRGGPKIRRLLAGHETGGSEIPKNVMEQRFRRILCDAGLPEPVMHAELLGYEIDFLWPDLRVAVETDGRSVHARRKAFAPDRKKDRDLQLAGYIAPRFTYAEIMYEPELVTAECSRACALAQARASSAMSPAR